MTKPYRWAVVFGKFMPPHIGHEYLISLACELADETSVFVAHPFHPNAEMPSTLRAQWLQAHFGSAISVHCPPEGTRGEVSTREAIRRGRAYFDTLRGDRMPDVLVSADKHTRVFAWMMGIKALIPHAILTTRATPIRARPLAHWDQILPPARPFFLKEAIFVAPAARRRRIAAMASDAAASCLDLAALPPEHFPASLAATRRVARRGLVIMLGAEQASAGVLDLIAHGPNCPKYRKAYVLGPQGLSHPALQPEMAAAISDNDVRDIIERLLGD